MAMRVSETMKFRTMTDNLFKVQNSYNELMEKMASQKTINRPSDDPLGMSRILTYRKSQASAKQYSENIDSSTAWITMTESKLTGANDLLVRAKEIALSQTTATASAETREIAAVEVQQIIEQMRTLANSQYGDRYLFSGTKVDEAPFSSSESAAAIGAAAAASGNTFDGTVTPGAGPYTGSVNKTYVAKIVGTGAFGVATYQVSSDGGETWSATNTVPAGGTITLGEGIDMTFTAGTADLTADDVFYVHATAAGYYNGNGKELSVEIGKNMNFDYSIPGESVFTDKGAGAVDIFKSLDDLKTALESNDPDGIGAQLGNLESGAEQVNKYVAKCGSRTNRLEIAGNNLADLDYTLTELISNTEDVDVSELITRFSMKEIVLKASYTMASSIGDLSIIDFIR
jgi:flagellar hook-associated protein 3 FlgL